MKLDFSVLEKNLKKPTENAAESFEDANEPVINLYQKRQRENADHEKNVKMYREYQENIRASAELQTQIAKGIKYGDPEKLMLLEACKVISLMTGNTVFYRQIEEDVCRDTSLKELLTEQKANRQQIVRTLQSLEQNQSDLTKSRTKADIRENQRTIADIDKKLQSL